MKLDVHLKQVKLIAQAKTKAGRMFYVQRLSGAWGHDNHPRVAPEIEPDSWIAERKLSNKYGSA